MKKVFPFKNSDTNTETCWQPCNRSLVFYNFQYLKEHDISLNKFMNTSYLYFFYLEKYNYLFDIKNNEMNHWCIKHLTVYKKHIF